MDDIEVVQIKQEDGEEFKFVISEVLFVESEPEYDHEDPQVIEELPKGTSDPLSQILLTETPLRASGDTQCRPIGRHKRHHSSAFSSAHVLEPPELEGGAGDFCDTSIMDVDGEQGSHRESAVPRSLPRRTRKPTQKMIENLCRLCEKQSYGLLKIFSGKGNQMKLAEQIHLHLPIQVRKDDQLPQGVCPSCVTALKTCDELYHRSLNTDSNLRQIFLKEDSSKYFSLEDDIQTLNLVSTQGLATDVAAKQSSIKVAEVSGKTSTKSSSSKRRVSARIAAVSSIPEASTSVNVGNEDYFSNEANIASNNLEENLGGEAHGNEGVNDRIDDRDNDEEPIQNIDGNHGGEIDGDLNEDMDEDHVEDIDGFSNGDIDEDNDAPVDPIEMESRTCDICQKVFASALEVSKHRRTHSDEERLKCRVCGKVMPNDNSFRSHMTTHTDNVHPCPTCGKILSSKTGLRNHLLTHEDPKFCCQICGKTMRTVGKLQSHMIVHSDEKPFECSECGQKFKSKGTLRQHKKIHSQNPSFICDICGYTVHRKSHLDKHRMNAHKNGQISALHLKYPCDMCNMKFAFEYNLVRHRVAAHNVKPKEVIGEGALESSGTAYPIDLFCVFCDKQFLDKETFNTHKLEVHRQTRKRKDGAGTVNVTKYQCSHCDRKLYSKRSLERHERIHTGERPFPCKVCGMGLISEVDRELHERRHFNIRPHKCDKCEKAFFSYTNLYQHKQIHSPKRKFKCDFCTYETHRPAAIKVHMRTHTGEKPYACELCDRSYKSSWDLKLHSRKHTGEPPIRRIRPKPVQKNVENPVVYVDAESSDSLIFGESMPTL